MAETHLGRRLALITGASSGIGRAIARALGKDGYSSLLVARREDRLDSLRQAIRADGGEATCIVADLATEAGRERVLRLATGECGPIDVLVNNAGVGWYGYAEDMPWPVARQLIGVNVAAIAHLTLPLLMDMKAQGRGHVINIGSVAGDLGAQGVALYAGTKSFLRSFTRALQRETGGLGVQVSLVQVGIATGTEFYTRIGGQPGALRIPAGSFGASPERVASRVMDLLRRPRKVVYVPRVARAATLVEPVLWWALDLAGALHLRRAAAGSRDDPAAEADGGE